MRIICLVAGHHPVGGDHALGQPGRARGEQHLGDRIRRDRRMRRGHRRCHRRLQQVVEKSVRTSRRRIAADDQRHIRQGRGNGGREPRSVAGIDQPGRQQRRDVLELAVVGRDQRIGRRDRRVGNADPDRGQAEQEMLDLVARNDHQRPLGPRSGIEQRLRQRLDARRARLPKAELPPGIAIAVGDQHRVGCLRRPRLRAHRRSSAG